MDEPPTIKIKPPLVFSQKDADAVLGKLDEVLRLSALECQIRSSRASYTIGMALPPVAGGIDERLSNPV